MNQRLFKDLLFVISFCCMLGGTVTLIDYLEETVRPRAFLKTFYRHATKRVIPAPHPGSHHIIPLFQGKTIKKTILGLIDGMQPGDTILITTFLMTDEAIYQALLKAHEQKVAIRVIADYDHAHKDFSKIPRLMKAGIPVFLYRHLPDDPEVRPGIMHNKFIIFDSRTQPAVLTGSYNLTESAATKNQENMVLIQDLATVAAFKEHFYTLQAACVVT